MRIPIWPGVRLSVWEKQNPAAVQVTMTYNTPSAVRRVLSKRGWMLLWVRYDWRNREHADLPHRRLIRQLEADRDRMLGAADAASVEEVRIAQSSLAAGYLHAIAWTLQTFEGPRAREEYLREHADGQHLSVHDEQGGA